MEWTGARYADGPTAEVETWIDAPPERVWPVVTDVGAMAELSEEVQEVAWLDEGDGPALGRRFTGRNRHAAIGEWTTTSHVVECEEPRVFAWAVEDPDNPSATWRFTLEPRDGGTLLRQWVRIGPGPSGLTLVINARPDREQKIVFVRMREHESAMTRTVAGIKARVEARAEGAG
ncbi:SRPBCC family protein [Actinomadura kijaniata]|uniref:SRPBCC family protein n=1 Tax=Actinomadura kijaniata TaxID=46161 RepID=UPI003F1A8820